MVKIVPRHPALHPTALCERARLAVSTRADGEPGPGTDVLGAHLAACEPCRRFALACLGASPELVDLVRPLRLRPARRAPPELQDLLRCTSGGAAVRLPAVVAIGRRHRWDVRRALSWAATAVPAGAFAVMLPVTFSHAPAVAPSHVATPCTIELEAHR
jgi:hypothetical protein